MTVQPGARDISALTAIRGFAAWWVVLYHCKRILATHVNDFAMGILWRGYLAVDMFFVLSGFVIYLNYAEKIERKEVSASEFLVKRIARIYPLHFLMLMATLAYAVLAFLRNGSLPEVYGLKEFVLNLTLLHNWGFTDVLSWNVPSWSISTEMAAYLLFPLLPLLLVPRRWADWQLPVAIGVLAFVLHAYFASHGAIRLGWNTPKTGLLRCLVQFSMGALVCEMYRRLDGMRGAAFVSGALLVSVMGALAGVLLFRWPETLVLFFLWSALILGVALWPARLPNPLGWRPLVYVGDISYATYLCHYLAFIVFKLLFVDDLDSVPLPAILLFLGSVAVASVLLYHGFERPAQRWVIARWRARAPRALAARG